MTNKWFFVYKDNEDGQIKAVDSPSNNMSVDHPELDDVWCLATKAEDEERAIQNATELDNQSDDKILSQ